MTTFDSVFPSGQRFLKIHDLFDLHQKPAVNLREVENFIHGESSPQRVADEEDAFGVGHAQFAADDVAREDVAVAIDFPADALGFAVAAQTAAADLQRAQAFLQAFLERAADGHCFTHGFHLRGERGVGLRKFLRRQCASRIREIGDDVIHRQIEA